MIKRAFDCTAALIVLVFLSPLFIAVAIAIALDSRGPVFYRAARIGKDGRPFAMLKFRTMVDGPGGEGPRVTASDDPRVTRLGRFLRNTKLNELPQLFNVLTGEMSLVGPRPEDPQFVAHYTAEQRRVLSVRPGITSPASVLYRHEESMLAYHSAAQSYLHDILPHKLRLDLRYVRSQSFLLDLDVLVQTLILLMPVLRQESTEAANIFFGPIQRLVRKRLPWFLLDWLTAVAGAAMAGLTWHLWRSLDLGWESALLAGFGLALAFNLTNWLLGLQRIAWRYASAHEVQNVVLSAGLATALLAGTNQVLPSRLPVGLLLLAGGFTLAGLVAVRYRSRLLFGLWGRCRRILGITGCVCERVLVVGGGEAGQMTVWMLQNGVGAQAFEVVGIVDDDLWKRGACIRRARVLGDRTCIPQVVREQSVDLIVFAIHNADPAAQESILEICRATLARVVVMPDIAALLAPPARAGRPAAGLVAQGTQASRLPGVAARAEH